MARRGRPGPHRARRRPGRGWRPDPPDRAQPFGGHRPSLPHRPDPARPDEARPPTPAPRRCPGHRGHLRGKPGRRLGGIGRDSPWNHGRLRRRPSWRFDIGTAGSAPLLFQTLCWPLALAGMPTQLSLLGGHPPGPQPLLPLPGARLGAGRRPAGVPVRALPPAGRVLPGRGWRVQRLGPARPRHAPARPPAPGHAPRGGGRLARRRGGLRGGRAAGRPRPSGGCGRRGSPASHGPSPCRAARPAAATSSSWPASSGSAPATPATSEGGREPDRTADAAVADFSRFLDGHGAVDRHLADQLLLPAALVAAGRVPRPAAVDRATRFTVGEVTRHLSPTPRSSGASCRWRSRWRERRAGRAP